MTIADLHIGSSATIVSVDPGLHAMRLNEMGLVSGETVTVTKKALWGDPIEVKVMNYQLCLRKDEASAIKVTIK